MKGPVVTPRSLQITTDQFTYAAIELETRQLGAFVKVENKGKPSVVFVKKSPEQARPALELNEDLCTYSVYESRYKQPVSKSITLNMRAYLANKGFISAKLLR